MPVWTLTIDGVTKTLTEWGIEEESLQIVYRSLDRDQLAFAMKKADALAEPAFSYGDAVALFQDGTCRFRGVIRKEPVAGSATAERTRFIAYNAWDDLDRLVYKQVRQIINDTFDDYDDVSTTGVVLGQDAAGLKIDTEEQIDDLLAYAITAGVSLAKDVNFAGVTPMWEEAHDITVAAGLRRMAGWTPDLVTICDYSTNPPTVRIRRRANATAYSLNLLTSGLVRDFTIDRRDDLVPAGVTFVFLGSVTDEATGTTYEKPVAEQVAGTASGPGVITATIKLSGEGGDAAEEVPADLADDYYAALSTVFYEGSLTLFQAPADPSWLISTLTKLSFAGGRSAWTTAAAMVQEIVVLPGAGVTEVRFQPPAQLQPGDFFSLNGRLAESQSAGSTGLAQTKTSGYASPPPGLFSTVDVEACGPSGPRTLRLLGIPI